MSSRACVTAQTYPLSLVASREGGVRIERSSWGKRNIDALASDEINLPRDPPPIGKRRRHRVLSVIPRNRRSQRRRADLHAVHEQRGARGRGDVQLRLLHLQA